MKTILAYTVPAGTILGKTTAQQDITVDVQLDESRLWQIVKRAATNKNRRAVSGPLVLKVRK